MQCFASYWVREACSSSTRKYMNIRCQQACLACTLRFRNMWGLWIPYKNAFRSRCTSSSDSRMLALRIAPSVLAVNYRLLGFNSIWWLYDQVNCLHFFKHSSGPTLQLNLSVAVVTDYSICCSLISRFLFRHFSLLCSIAAFCKPLFLRDSYYNIMTDVFMSQLKSIRCWNLGNRYNHVMIMKCSYTSDICYGSLLWNRIIK
jgi:hypothetical protein